MTRSGSAVTPPGRRGRDVDDAFIQVQRLPQDATAEALDDATICVMSRYDVGWFIMAHPEVGLRFLEQVGARLAGTRAAAPA